MGKTRGYKNIYEYKEKAGRNHLTDAQLDKLHAAITPLKRIVNDMCAMFDWKYSREGEEFWDDIVDKLYFYYCEEMRHEEEEGTR